MAGHATEIRKSLWIGRMSKMSRYFESQIEAGNVTYEDFYGEEICYVNQNQVQRTPANPVKITGIALSGNESGGQLHAGNKHSF